MRSDAGLHPDQVRRHIRKTSLYLATRPLLTQHDRTAIIEAYDVERVLPNIDTNYGDRILCVRTLRAPCLGAPGQLIAGGAGARPDHPISGLGPHDGADGSRSPPARAFGSFAGHVDSPQHPTISFGRNRMSHPAIMAEGRVCAI